MKHLILCICLLLLVGCSTAPPKNINDSCEIFREKSDWYDDTKDSFEHWGVPIHWFLKYWIKFQRIDVILLVLKHSLNQLK